MKSREDRILDISKVRDNRYKGAGIHIDERNRARCTAVLCEWITDANTERGGTSPFPYGLLFLTGDPDEVLNMPDELKQEAFLEIVPCDRPDRRAVRLNWNPAGTEADFSFVPIASLLNIDVPAGTTLWMDAIPLTDTRKMPVVILPLGSRIQTRPAEESAPAKQGDSTGG